MGSQSQWGGFDIRHRPSGEKLKASLALTISRVVLGLTFAKEPAAKDANVRIGPLGVTVRDDQDRGEDDRRAPSLHSGESLALEQGDAIDRAPRRL